MAATMQHCGSATTTSSPSLKPATNTSPNPQLKRLVYSKYRELLGSYNDQANAYIETLPSYMVQKDNGFNLETQSGNTNNNLNGAITTIHLTSSSSPSPAAPSSLAANEMYGSGQRMPPQSTYEAPACVQNAMNRDKKPFTYTPGGIDLSQIKSERMAKRLARNACAEGAAGKSQQNRPVVTPISPGSPGCAAATIGAAAMGMPFQVLPPSPHLNMAAGKNINGGCAPAPPPPPPPSSSNFLNTGSQMNGNNGMNGVRGSSPNSPNMQQQRKIPPAPPSQRFEPPPLGFRPEIKIPPNPMAGLRKVPPPVEKNTFWKDEYKKNKVADEAPSHRVEATNMPMNNSHNVNGSSFYAVDNDSVNGSSSTTPQTNASNGTDQLTTNGETNFKTDNSDYIDGFKKTMPTTTTNKMQANQTNNLTNTQEPEAIKTPPTSASSPPSQESPQKSPQATSPDTQSIASINRPTPSTSPQQQALIKANTSSPSPQPSTAQQQVERESATPPAAVAGPPKPASSPPQAAIHLQTEAQQQKQQSPKPEFRSVAAASPQPAAVNVFNRQTDSPRSVDNATPPRVTDSPFRLAQQQQQRPPVAISPLAAQQQMAPMAGATISPNNQAQTVPWRTQRSQTPQQQAPPSAQSHPQPFYGSMPQQQQQQQQQRTPDFSTQTSAYQGPKPTNVGSLYIAPLAAPPEPQAQHIVMQQMQQQQPQRDSPMRQMGSQPTNQQLRWMSSQPKQTEQPAWARPEENGNVVPSSLNRLKSPPPQQQQQQTTFPGQGYQQMYQPQPQPFQAPGNGFMTNPSMPQNFGALHNAPAGLRLQINTNLVQNTNNTINQSGPREHIIPIQLEQTPTYAPAQPTFNAPSSFSAGTASPGYVMRTPNQFVDQGYNNYGTHQSTPQRVMSPPQQQQQLNAPRMVQQQQQQSNIGNNRTHIVPIAVENNEGIRGPISKTPIVIQNDLRTPPVQSKSFRILQKITDTIDDGNNDDSGMIQQRNDNYMDAEPQLQRPTFARQMSAQLARNSPTVEQMRRMKIGQEQGNSTPQTPSQFNQQPRPFYNSNNEYVPPSEQQVPEPKKYTGSAIPSRSFKILQAMTQPENAGEQDNVQEYNDDANDETKSEGHNDSCTSSSVEPTSSASSMSSLSSTDSVRSGPSRPSPQPMAFPPYPYPYAYPWYPPPPHAPCPLPSSSSGDSVTNPSTWPYPYAVPASPVNGETANAAASWPYAPPYGMPPPPNTANGENGQQPTPFPPYPYYYPYYPIPPFPTHSQSSEFDPQNVYAPYLPPPPPYHVYPYPVAPSYSQTSSSSRASSVLPDIIITPSTDDVPSQVVLKHHIKVDKDKLAKRSKSVDIEDVSSIKSNSSLTEGSVVDILSQHLQNMAKRAENNSSSSQSTKSSEKTVAEKPKTVHIAAVKHAVEHDSDSESSVDSDATTKQYDNQTAKEGSVPLQSIKSVTNVQIYNALKQQPEDEEDESEEEEVEEEDDDTTADGESDVFDEEAEEEEEFVYEHHEEHDSGSEDYIVDDGLSVIYEEESDFDKSSENNKPLRNAQALEDLNKCIEEDDDHDDDENENDDGSDAEQEDEDNCDTNSVTVRLPLKFSFTKSANSEPVAATVEVGKSLVEERRKSIPQPNCFKIATIESDSEADDSDSCGVSVTISLSQSSRSGSVDSKESERKTTAEKYPLEDMPVPENLEAKLNASQEDVSFSFSLNKRNKFVGQTLKGDLTNNITQVEEESPKEAERTPERKQSAEELDFFATLMATKMQAQKIKEQSASYWGKGKEQKQEPAEVQAEDKETQKKIDEEELKARTSFWAKYSAIKPAEVKADKSEETCSSYDKSDSSNANETQSSWDNNSSNNDSQITNDGEGDAADDDEIEDIWADREEIPVIRKETQTSYWDTFAKSNTDYQAVDNQLKDNNECLESDEIEDIWADQNDDDYIPVRKPQTTCVELESPVEVQLHEEEVVDIWAERDECDDVSAVKVRSKKLDSLETARDSFWSTVAQANKCSGDTQNDDDTEFWSEQKMSKPQMKQEIITEICYSPTVLRHRIEELSKSLKPTVHVVEEEKEEEKELEPELKTQDEEVEVTEDEEEVDFWAKIDESREAKASEASSAVVEPSTPEFDPLKYPEEPREVDTDEEIDFWAEIDANRLPDDTDITFHRAASFWASRDLRNSIDETPYKPVQTKAFPAKLPDDPIADETGLWATLEAHKGEEAVLVDPLVEEEKELAQEFDEMSQQPDLYEEEEEEYVDPATEEPVAQAEVCSTQTEVWQTTPPAAQTEVWQTTPPAAQTEVWQSTLPAAQTEVWHSIPSTQTEFWQATPPAVQTEIWQTTPTAAQTEIWQPTPAVMGKYEAWRATPTMEMADVWSAPTTTLNQNTVEQSTQPEFNTEAEVNPNSAIEKELNAPEKDELEVKRNNYRKAMAFFTTSIDEHKEESPALSEKKAIQEVNNNCHSFAAEEQQKWSPLEQEQQQQINVPPITEEFKKPPKKENKPKGKSKSPKGKSKEIKCNTPSTETPEVYVEPSLEMKRLPNGLPDLGVNKFNEERKISVRDRISVFESGATEIPEANGNTQQSLSVDGAATRRSSLSRHSSSQRSESEVEEDDSGVTDMNKLSETETESGSFPELRKMSSYQRAATHSRLFKLLQDDTEGLEDSNGDKPVDEFQLRPSRRKVVHNVSITRKQNPQALAEVETMSQRRERLSLPLRKNTSIDADNPSTPNSPASPIMDHSANQCVVSDKLVSELVQSLLLKSDSTHLRKLPMEKLQAAAKRVLEEELDSLDNTSVDSTPSMTPNELKKDRSYADYYNTWSDANGSGDDVVPSKSFKALQDPRRSPWTVRCPRVLSSKTINRDLARVTESPEIHMRSSMSPECFRQSRENSVSRWRKA